MDTTCIYNARIINEGRSSNGWALIEGDTIAATGYGAGLAPLPAGGRVIDAGGRWLMPGVIDDHVHFREPGLTHKADIASESRAAVAGGVTTFMDMPNTVPQTTSVNLLEWKLQRAASTSVANYSFFPGVTGDNAGEICKADPRRVPGVKVFLGSSTGGMLVDRLEALERIFGQTDLPVVVHAEKEEIIRRQAAHYMALYGDDPDVSLHPLVRSAEACYASSAEAVGMASRLGARLHILHLSTARELSLLDGRLPAAERRITAEACVHYLWFSDEDYALMGSRIKCNPSIKAASDRDALRQAVGSGLIDVVATDHAPHLLSEKGGGCFRAASGLPVVQHSLTVMLELASRGFFPPERVVEVMAHRPADLFGIDRRGYVRPGYFADLVLVDPAAAWTVTAGNVLYKCGWSPFEGVRFGHKVWKTFVNGRLVYDDGLIDDSVKGMEVAYVR